jgi:hypothetical protein
MGISEIAFIGPFSWAEAFTVPETHKQGIYLHTVQVRDHYLVYYAGETGERFLDCMRRHNRYYRAAKYPILPAASFAQGSNEGRLNQGMFGGAGLADSPDVCKANRVRLAKQIQEMLGVMQVLFAPFETDERTRRRIEAAIMNRLDTPNSFYWKGVNRARRNPLKGEVEFRCRISCPVKLLGMPEWVWA